MREDGAEQGRARSPAVREVPAQDGDARELAGPGGSTAFPSSPIPKAENTWPKRGCGSGSAWSIVSRHESERARTERRLSRTPTITQRQVTASNAW